MRVARTAFFIATWCALGTPGMRLLHGQEIQLGLGENQIRRQHVELQTDAVQVKANAPDWVELRFRVDAGFHINSHTPKDELLVPTSLELKPSDQVQFIGQEYPAGIPLRLDVGAGEVLSTYQGEFRVRVQLKAAKGATGLEGTLKYQACDARSCFPPRSLPIKVALAAR